MAYTVAFGLLGAVLAGWAVVKGGWFLLLLWPAANLWALFAAYAHVGPKAFGKRSDGVIPLRIKILYLPFLLYVHLIRSVANGLSDENPVDQITPELLLGRRVPSSQIPEGVTYCVDLTAEFDEPREIRESTHYINLPILDGSVPSVESLHATLAQLADGTTFVHCAQGHGRTGVFALAFLAERGLVRTFEEGYSLIRETRPRIHLNRTQERFIRSYIQEFGGSASLKVDPGVSTVDGIG
jgi:protein-tyrosine phosphatase